MLTAITYNCDPESLADAVSQQSFVDAFENKVRVKPQYRELTVAVTFESALYNGVSAFESDDWEADISHEEEFRAEFKRFAEKAWAACL